MCFWKFTDRNNYQNWCSAGGVFSPPEIQEILSFKEKASKQDGKVGHGVINVNVRNSNIWWIKPQEDTEWLFDRIESTVVQLNDLYFHLKIDGLRSLQLTQYDEATKQFYNSHSDSGPQNNNRKLSVSIQLTDPILYEGGDLLLYPDNLKPVACPKWLGTINIFRSHILHEVTPVTKGTRYSLVTWIEGPIVC